MAFAASDVDDPVSLLAQAQLLCGLAPSTKAPKDRKEGVDLGARGSVMPKEDVGDAIQLATLALLCQLAEGRKKKKKKHPKSRLLGVTQMGNSDSGESDSSDSERGASLSAGGSKGYQSVVALSQSMERYPKLYADHMETLAMKALGWSEKTPHMMSTYTRKIMAVEKQRTLGFFVTILSEVWSAIHRNEFEAARLHTLKGLAAAEQSCLDSNWATAWDITHLRQPPWSDWESMNATIIRREHTFSPLVEPAWMSTIISKIKETEVLMKRRSHKKPE